ncbi:MAG: NADH-quinone oxidoreductase subunit H [Eubacteriales bacterium]|nr:NADH-quinone oxidoreductase subunit H [Eubacteriales bacterium]
MSVIISTLMYLGFILIFPGFLFCFFCGMLLCGIERKIVARMQKRVGPPILQPWYDFFKLCGKETIIPTAANKKVFLFAPVIGLAALVVIQLFIPVFGFTAFSGNADIIVILYLLLVPALAEIFGASASGSPYAGIGLSREMVTIISCELPLVLVLLAVGKAVGNAVGTGVCFSLQTIAEYQIEKGSLIKQFSMIPAAAAFLLVIPGEIGSHPFDTAEAETEICEGMLAEYSGPPLAINKLSHAVKMFTMTSLFCALFLGGLGVGIMTVDALIVLGLSIIITVCVVALINAATARLKIEQLFKYYWTFVSGLAALSLILAWFGL